MTACGRFDSEHDDAESGPPLATLLALKSRQPRTSPTRGQKDLATARLTTDAYARLL